MADENDLSYWQTRTREHGSASVGYGCNEKLIALDNELRGRAIERFVRFRPGMTLLDVGTASGHWAIKAARAGATVTGLDFNRDILAIAEQRAAEAGVEVTWMEGALEEVDLPNRHFDAILSVTCLQHITDRERQKRALSRILGSLKPGGVFVLIEDTMPPGTKPGAYLLATTQQEWIALVESQGGRLIDYVGVSFVRFRLRPLPPRICVAIDRVLGGIRAARGNACVTAFAFGVHP